MGRLPAGSRDCAPVLRTKPGPLGVEPRRRDQQGFLTRFSLPRLPSTVTGARTLCRGESLGLHPAGSRVGAHEKTTTGPRKSIRRLAEVMGSSPTGHRARHPRTTHKTETRFFNWFAHQSHPWAHQGIQGSTNEDNEDRQKTARPRAQPGFSPPWAPAVRPPQTGQKRPTDQRPTPTGALSLSLSLSLSDDEAVGYLKGVIATPAVRPCLGSPITMTRRAHRQVKRAVRTPFR